MGREREINLNKTKENPAADLRALAKRVYAASIKFGVATSLILSACSTAPEARSIYSPSLEPIRVSAVFTPSQAATSESTETSTLVPLPEDFWEKLPVIPEGISDRVREIYRLGLSEGNNPHIFSRIGDCNSAAPAFLTGFDRNYNLGEYTYLQSVIDYFQGSFARPSWAAKNGLNSAGLLSTILAPSDICLNNETLLDCQYRLDRPSFAIISIGTNEAYYVYHKGTEYFENNMRQIIENTIAQGIVPILRTKADNIEGDNSINRILANLALEYQLPLWNFWSAAQRLPDNGMRDESHLNTVSYSNFTDFTIPHSLEYGTQMQNLTALQMLYFLQQQLAPDLLSPD